MRFIARLAVHHDLDSDRADQTLRPLAAVEGMKMAYESKGLAIAVTGDPFLPCGPHGLLLGHVFRRSAPARVDALTLDEQAAIRASRGQWLIDHCWGAYLAFLDEPGSPTLVIRAPWGDLPCYRYARDGIIHLASDIALLMACADDRPSVAWPVIAAQLVHGPFHHRATCLEGITQLPGGECWSITRHGEHRETLWSPWDHAAPERQIADARQAEDLIRRTAQSCVSARAAQFNKALVTLSGGLDSSIVAACLADRPGACSAMTLVTRDAIGDERAYATQVAEALHIPLHAKLREASRVDVRTSGAANRPYPCVKGFQLESMRLIDEAADEAGARAIFNGAGGDTIFCSLQSGAPAADRLRAEGLGRGFWRTVGDISQLAPASMAQVLRDALARAWLGKPAFRLRPRFDLLSTKACALAGAEPDHPWRRAPAAIPPGRAFQVWLLAHFKHYVETFDPQSRLPVVAPLLSQPLVEACLTIPSWMWFDGGQNRIVARRAFAGLLPPAILSRRSKGTPGSFTFEIFETHRATIRAMLAEGQLARHDLIDLPGVLHILDDPRPQRHESVERILDLLDVEAWATGWSHSLR